MMLLITFPTPLTVLASFSARIFKSLLGTCPLSIAVRPATFTSMGKVRSSESPNRVDVTSISTWALEGAVSVAGGGVTGVVTAGAGGEGIKTTGGCRGYARR